MKPRDEHKETAPACPRWVGYLAVAFWAAVAVWVGVWVVAPYCRRTVSVPFTEATSLERFGGHCYKARFSRPLPREATIREDTRELVFSLDGLGGESGRTTDLAPEQIAAFGMGNCRVDYDTNIIHWSSSDGTDPLTNGRTYRIVGSQRWRPNTITRSVAVLVPLLLALALTFSGGLSFAATPGWRQNLLEAIDLRGKSPRWLRWALALIVLISLVSVAAPWNRFGLETDTYDYCMGTLNRTPLTFFFVKALDPHCSDNPLVPLPRGFFHDAHSHWLIPVNAWKVAWVLAAVALVLSLARFVNVWLLAGSLCWLGAVLAKDNELAHTCRLDVIISEPLCYCLVLLYLAATVQYLFRRPLFWGAVLGVVLAALVLIRPNNSVFLAVLPAAWLVDWKRSGFWRASMRTAMLTIPLVLGTLAVCQYNQEKHGCFKTYAFKGYYLIAPAIQIGSPDDAEAFSDPKMKEFAKLCLTYYGSHYYPEWSVLAADNNTFTIGYLSFYHVYIDPIPWNERPNLSNYYSQSEEKFTALALKVIPRHKAAYLRIVWTNVKVFWSQNPRTHAEALTAIALAFLLFLRKRYKGWLFLAFFAATPFLSMLPCLMTLYPLERYGSQLFFAEVLALPLVAALAATRGLGRMGQARSEPSSYSEMRLAA